MEEPTALLAAENQVAGAIYGRLEWSKQFTALGYAGFESFHDGRFKRRWTFSVSEVGAYM